MSIRDELVTDLKNKKPTQVVTKWLMERPTPHVFQNDHPLFTMWKLALANKLGVDPHSIVVVGSACVGISLNPLKNWGVFGKDSDIDVAVVSNVHFEQSWYFLRHIGTDRFRLSEVIREAIKKHELTYVFWGTIATDKILGVLPFGKAWLKALGEMSKIPPSDNRDVNLRLYKDFESLRAYQIRTMKKLRQKVLGTVNP